MPFLVICEFFKIYFLCARNSSANVPFEGAIAFILKHLKVRYLKTHHNSFSHSCKNVTLLSRNMIESGRGATRLFFSGRGVRPGFPKCESNELIIASEKGVL